MMPFMNILVFLTMLILAAAFVTLCIGAVRSIVGRLLMYLAIYIPQPIRPLLDPSANPIDWHPEYAFWDTTSWLIMAISTVVFAAFLYDIVTQFWYLLCAL